MKTTDKQSCRTLADLLVAHGIEDIVLSPGSRNAPIIIAAARHKGLKCHTVIDERQAAFVGLGIALQTAKPVALACTSGSAILNYGPALSEAYYRHIPLIAISADRPHEWIDQDDSQTIRQYKVLDNIVKNSYEIDVENGSDIQNKFVSRIINDAIICAKRQPCGPVHINICLDEPLGQTVKVDETTRKIDLAKNIDPQLYPVIIENFANKIKNKKVLVIAGFGRPDNDLDSALSDFADKSGAAIMHEAQSNIHLSRHISNIDATLAVADDETLDALKPDIVITFGGSIVSRMIKRYLRSLKSLEHWHIGFNENSIDCFMSLSSRIETHPVDFFKAINRQLDKQSTSYSDKWIEISEKAANRTVDFQHNCKWSDFYAMGRIMQLIPYDWQLQLSNGTAVRYAQLFDYAKFSRVESNRGVSGIDGSTSTAVGAHMFYPAITLLITGDMSAQYDVGALGLSQITPRFKMAVLNNSGGGIFRFIKSTSVLDECEDYFACKTNLPLKQLAAAYGFAYYEIDRKESFDSTFADFAAQSEKPAILNIITPPSESATILKQYFNVKS